MLAVIQSVTSFKSHNLQTPYSAWSVSTTYNFLDYVTHKNYEYRSILDSNTGVDPSENTGKWLMMQVSNVYAALDLQSGTRCVCDSTTVASGTDYDLTLQVYCTQGDNILIGAAEGSSIEIKEFNVSDVLQATTTKTIDETELSPALDYHYTVSDPDTTYVQIIVYEKTVGGYSALGWLIVGEGHYLGDIQYGVKPGFTDYSTYKKDYNGQLTTLKEDIRDTLSADLVYAAAQTMPIKRAIKSLKGQVVGFVGDTTVGSKYENLLILGTIEDFTPVVANPVKTFANITIMEVI